MSKNVIVINIGSTSTKLALYCGSECKAVKNYTHSVEALKGCETIFDQVPIRTEAMRQFMADFNIAESDVDAIVPRYPYINSRYPGHAIGNRDFVEMARTRDDAFHIMFITPLVAWEVFGDRVPMLLPDVMANVDVPEELMITGVPQMRRSGKCHVENMMAVALKYAEENGKDPNNMSLVIGHMGGGVSFSWYYNGKIRYCLFDGEAGFSPERGGVMPSLALIDLCFSGQYSKKEMQAMIKGAGGLVAHLGTTDCVEVENRIEAGDEKAKLVYDAMILRAVGCIGEAAAIAGPSVEQILLTGGIARGKYVTDMISAHVEHIAPVTVYAGEYEMDYFASFGAGVLDGSIEAREYALPER